MVGLPGDDEIRSFSTAEKVLNVALDEGINFLDTAACYGISEETIGLAVAHRRSDYVLATKAGHYLPRGEGEDYSENKYIYRFNPPGHWYEIPNLIKNGCLASMLKDNPNLKYLFCHNIDTMGAYIEPVLLGMHINKRSHLTFEVTPRRIEDKGGGLD